MTKPRSPIARLCAHHAKILEEIVRDANREKGRHPRYRGKKVAA